MAHFLPSLAVVSLAASLITAGCGPRDPLGFTPVTGRVTFDGQPLDRGEIWFTPDSAAGTAGPMSIGTLGPEGEFMLWGPGGRRGAVPGQHRVFLAMLPEYEVAATRDGGEAAASDGQSSTPTNASSRKVPRRYLAAATSGLTATITRGEPAWCEFDLVSSAALK